MKFHYHYEQLSYEIDQEIGFKKYLEQFSRDLPLIPHLRITPLSFDEAKDHYASIQNILEKKLNVNRLINYSKELPFIEDIFPYFSKKDLQLYHLFSLGTFVKEIQKIHAEEKMYPLTEEQSLLFSEIDKILSLNLNPHFNNLIEEKQDIKIREKLSDLKKNWDSEISQIESMIYEKTGQKIIYPYGKEIPINSHSIPQLKLIDELSLKIFDHFVLAEIKVPGRLKKLQSEIEKCQEKYQKNQDVKIQKINTDLYPLLNSFENYYSLRIKRIWHYLICQQIEIHKNRITIPQFIDKKDDIDISKGHLPALEEISGPTYKHLNLRIKMGTQIIFGGNMTGKTTVLKTLFFILVCAKLGLPLPAEKAKIIFPEEIFLLLKSSGKIQKGLSSFGEELSFFCQSFPKNSYLLIDELFQSTDPINGVRLSEMFLSYFRKINLVFFCSSQYPDVLKLKGSKLFRMKCNEEREDRDLLKPLFELEEIVDMANSPLDNKHPLKLALTFPLPEDLKILIRGIV